MQNNLRSVERSELERNSFYFEMNFCHCEVIFKDIKMACMLGFV